MKKIILNILLGLSIITMTIGATSLMTSTQVLVLNKDKAPCGGKCGEGKCASGKCGAGKCNSGK